MQTIKTSLLDKFKSNWLISSFALIGIGSGLVFTGLEKGILPYVAKSEYEQLKKNYDELNTTHAVLTIDNEKNKALIERLNNEIKQLHDAGGEAKKSEKSNDEVKPLVIDQKTQSGTNIGIQNNHGGGR